VAWFQGRSRELKAAETGASDSVSTHLRYFLFSVPEPSNSNIVAREIDVLHRGSARFVLQLRMACERHRKRATAAPNHLD
jgi:hypothetical protein